MSRLRIAGERERRMRCLANSGVDDADMAMERYANGDDAAFAELYDAIAPRLLGFLRKATRDGNAAEDLMQQAFLQIHQARGSFIPGARVMPWAFAIARRLMIDSARRRRAERACSGRSSRRRSVDVRTDVGSRRRRLGRAPPEQRVQQRLDALPEIQRTAYQLVKQEGLSLKRAAEVLGTSVTAVKLRTHRAYQALRAVLREEGGAA